MDSQSVHDHLLSGRRTVEAIPNTYTIETEAFTLKNPTKSGYTFTGWSGTGLDGENNMTVTIPTGSTGNRTDTAHWRYNGSGSGGGSPAVALPAAVLPPAGGSSSSGGGSSSGSGSSDNGDSSGSTVVERPYLDQTGNSYHQPDQAGNTG